MSALGGFWSFGGNDRPVDACRTILDAQHAYGPHDTCVLGADRVTFGRNLHRTLPEDAFDEGPLTDIGGRTLFVADVRLDNRDELIARLGLRDARTMADAAILFAGYRRWNEGVLDHILGDYAFAAWDRDERTLFLARDPLGQRPLCHHLGDGFFAFASMPKGLHALSAVPRASDVVRLAEFVGGLHHLGPRTAYAGVSRVEPGHCLTVRDGNIRVRRWWNPERRELRLARFEDYRDALRAELDRSVACRLRGAGELVATHLSSGWDSGAVTATAARLLGASGGRVAAFTSVPRPGSGTAAPFSRIGDEGPLAARTAAMHANVDHVLIPGESRSPLARLDPLLDLFDRPQVNLCNEEWLGRIRDAAAARGARVLLTGEVGNWSISNAPTSLLADLVRERRWGRWFGEARAKIRQGDARYRGVLASSFGPWLPLLIWRRFAPLSAAGPAANQTALRAGPLAELRQSHADADGPLGRPARDSFAQILPGLAAYDFGQFRKGALAGWGLDERDPTGDRRLIEFCLSLPVDMLLKNGVRRPLARAALADRLPAAVLAERSKGYQAADWHEGLTRDLSGVSALIERIAAEPEAAALINVDALRTWVAEWPTSGWDDVARMARYRNALLPALSAGHFIATMRA